MAMVSIPESGMNFGPFDEEHLFYIEKCKAILEINKKSAGIRVAEFLYLQNKNHQITISIIEAKTNAPKQSDDYINEIKEKLANSLALFVSFYLKRHLEGDAELPESFKQLDISKVQFNLILVIKNSDKALLPPLNDKLKKVLNATVKIWKLDLNHVKVINEEIAKRQKLVS